MVLIASCQQRTQHIELLQQKHLQNFSSASAVEAYQNRLYIFGDDAPYLLQTDDDFNITDTVYFFNSRAVRIDKSIKHDIEAAAIKNINGENVLLGFGSLSTGNRQQLFQCSFGNIRQYQSSSLQSLYEAMNQKENTNIEGAAFIADHLILANRANLSNKTNEFFIIGTDFAFGKFSVTNKIKIVLPNKNAAGISGLAYLPDEDILLFSASEEETTSTYADGAIGNSYIGLMDNISKKLSQNTLAPDTFIDLAAADKRFLNQKIEGITVISNNNNSLVLCLTADNDNGTSMLFKVRLFLPAQ